MDYSKAASDFVDRMICVFHTPAQRTMSDFPKGETFILNYLTDRDAPVMPSELSAALQASTARVAAALNSLEAKGFILRQEDSTDRRRILVTVTPQGANKVLEKRRKVHSQIESLMRQLGEEDAGELLRLLGENFRNCSERQYLPPFP